MNAFAYKGVEFGYSDGNTALSGIDLNVEAGDVVLVIGESGSGKSTLLRCANGLVPHNSGGRLAGEVIVFGRSTANFRPNQLADMVGFVHQDPESHFVADRVERDVAFGLENLGTDRVVMRRRVEEALDAMDVAHLRSRSVATLSGGEKQRCAIAAALANAPSALVLDEPTSQLDPQGAEHVFAALARLNADLGTTVLFSEHRLERAAPIADRALLMQSGRIAQSGLPAAVVANYDGAPVVTQLGVLLGWDPPPLTVRQARTMLADGTSDFLASLQPPQNPPLVLGDPLITARGITVALGGKSVLREMSMEVHQGEVIALLGRNGAGKTTLLSAIAGLLKLQKGNLISHGTTAYVPQDPDSLLFADSVRAELNQTLRLLGQRGSQATDRWLDALGLTDLAGRHPRTLSVGERQRVAIAAVAVGEPDVLLLDEPTRGMDDGSKSALRNAMSAHTTHGGAVIIATHDVELAARCASRVIVLGDGDVIADGPARAVLAGSLFAPQTMRVTSCFLTVDEVATAMRAANG